MLQVQCECLPLLFFQGTLLCRTALAITHYCPIPHNDRADAHQTSDNALGASQKVCGLESTEWGWVQENIGAMQITGVGSRRVIQIGACIAIIFGLIGGHLWMSLVMGAFGPLGGFRLPFARWCI